MKLTIELSKTEYCGIRAFAAQCEIRPQKILEQFVADLTHSDRTGGSDERLFAEQYMMRCNYASSLHHHDYSEEQQDHLDALAQRSDRWFAASDRHRLRAQAEWRKSQSLACGGDGSGQSTA